MQQRNPTSPVSWRGLGAVLLASAALALCLALGARHAGAVAVYTDRAAWEAAAGGAIVSDTFDAPIAFAPSITFASGVVSTGVGTDTVLTDSNTVDLGSYSGRVDTFNRLSNTFDAITWQFPRSIFAFGADWDGVLSGGQLTLTGDFDGAGAMTLNFADFPGFTGAGFIGIVGAALFDSVSFGTQIDLRDEIFFVDNLALSFAQVSTPGTGSMLGLGCIVLALALRRGRRPQPRA